MNNKEKADEAYQRAKTLFFSRETPDLSGAIKEMQESLRLDDRGNGDRQYQLAKLCLMAYQEEGEGKDAAFAILAHQYFSAALEKGKHVKNMYLSPIKDIAMINYRAAIDVYHKKEDHTFLAQAAAYLKHSISLGGLPDGDAEYDLARLYLVWGRKEKALGYFLKAQSRGCSKLTSEDENFMATMDRSLGESIMKPVDNPAEVQRLQLKLENTKRMLQEENDKLTQLRAKTQVNISAKVHDDAVDDLLKTMSHANLVGELEAIEVVYKEAKQDKNSLEYHVDALKSAGVPPKALLEMVSQYVDFSRGATQLFWIRKLGDFQKPIA